MSSDAENFVHYEVIDRVSVITLDRQPVNMYDGLFHVEFQDAWRQARDDDRTNTVVMQATGKHFCVGANLRNPQPVPEGRVELAPVDEIRLIKGTMKPTIAAVQGGCLGGGQRMVWPCDIVFCTDDAFFADPTVKMGIGGIQSHLHTWFYGPRLAKEMIFGSVRVPAQRLYAMGQVNRLFADAATMREEALTFAKDIASQDQAAIRQAKRAADITMDIQGQHYVFSRMAELMDEFPTFKPLSM